MYTYSQLLVRNLVLGAIFTVIIASITFIFSSASLKEKQRQQQSIAQLVFSNTQGNVEQVAQQLMQSQKYALLDIKSSTGEQIYKQSTPSSFIAEILLPKKTNINLKSQNIIISLQLAAEPEANLVIRILLSVAILTFCFVFATLD